MKNSIYEGLVTHVRLEPKRHQFTYGVSYYFFNLASPPSEMNLGPLMRFNRKNYLNSSEVKEQIRIRFGEDKSNQIANIFILTQLSYFGFCFNPVSFYYCYDMHGELLHILSLITNTPWQEKHINIFDFKRTKGDESFVKDFHVSPFMPMEIDYKWKFSVPQSRLEVKMFNHHPSDPKSFFFAEMKLAAKELNRKNVLLNFLKYPWMSLKTIGAIYWQAALLYIKGVPFHTHPSKKEAI